MKKQFLLFASLVISVMSFAQMKPSFGVKAGLSSATIKGDAAGSFNNLVDLSGGAFTTKSHTGFYAGAFASLPVSEAVSIEPGVYYSQKGYELNGALSVKGMDFLGANAKAVLNSNYIDVPLLLKVNMNGFQVFAGPQVSYLVNADLHTTAGALGFNILNSTMDATGQLNRWDAAVTGGLGYQFGNGLTLSAAYDHGLSRINAGKNLDAYNRSFKVGLGYRF